MPATAHLHVRQDVARAKAIIDLAETLPRATIAEASVRSDLLRSAWMFSVGAMDAYFCDAYADLVAATASSKARQPTIALPEWAYEIKLPLRAVLEDYKNPNWR
mgnify:CR=1 FL=1